MKRIVSVSLGSDTRDNGALVGFFGTLFEVSRIGTNGNFKAAQQMIRELDGQVDAIGLGGVDIYLGDGEHRYPLRDGLRLAECAHITPVVDGSGLKNTLERLAVERLDDTVGGKHVLLVCGLDRPGMARAFEAAGCTTTFGDKLFCLDIDEPMFSVSELLEQSRKLLPELAKLPISFLYPTGKKQIAAPVCKFPQYFERAEVIAGDCHIIRQNMPDNLQGKIILTNTITDTDRKAFRARGVTTVISTTPNFNGRNFGTNVLEAVMVAHLEKPWGEVTEQNYLDLIKEMQLKPDIQKLN